MGTNQCIFYAGYMCVLQDGVPVAPVKKKRVQIQEPAPWRAEVQAAEVAAAKPTVVLETGPVQYEEPGQF